MSKIAGRGVIFFMAGGAVAGTQVQTPGRGAWRPPGWCCHNANHQWLSQRDRPSEPRSSTERSPPQNLTSGRCGRYCFVTTRSSWCFFYKTVRGRSEVQGVKKLKIQEGQRQRQYKKSGINDISINNGPYSHPKTCCVLPVTKAPKPHRGRRSSWQNPTQKQAALCPQVSAQLDHLKKTLWYLDRTFPG